MSAKKKSKAPSRQNKNAEKNNGMRLEKRPVQPSWTGAYPARNTSQKRFQSWLCSIDNKCVPVEQEAFTENITWRIFRISEFVEGFDFLSRLEREVTFFGSARISSASPFYRVAKELGSLCGKNGYTVITGGGPGIMEAANWGAFEAGGESVGLDISLPMEQRRNQYVKRAMGFHYFFTRKVMLSASAQAYVFFPGGFGTLDELFEVVTLIQTGKMSNEVPVVLVGRAFWGPLMDWINTFLWQQHRFIEHEDIKLFDLVDTAEEAFAIIKKTKERTL
jgi:uncharacterized protein (TIGR00730 family)